MSNCVYQIYKELLYHKCRLTAKGTKISPGVIMSYDVSAYPHDEIYMKYRISKRKSNAFRIL